jgi:hypothetical protein
MAHGHIETGHPPHQNRVTHAAHARRDLHHTVSCRIKRETRAFSSADHVLGFLAVARTVCQHGSESSKKKESEVGTRKITEIDFLRLDGRNCPFFCWFRKDRRVHGFACEVSGFRLGSNLFCAKYFFLARTVDDSTG